MTAQIRVKRRPKAWPDYLRSYTVVLDGQRIGNVARNESLDLVTEPGQHEVHFTIDWCRSRSLNFVLAENDTIVIECWPNGTPVILMPYWLTFGCGRYIGIQALLEVLETES